MNLLPGRAVPAEELHGTGGIVSMALQSFGRKPLDRHVVLLVQEESGIAVWDFRSVHTGTTESPGNANMPAILSGLRAKRDPLLVFQV